MRSDGRKRGGALKLILVIMLLLVILICTTMFLYVQNLGFPYKKGSTEYVQIEIPEGTPASSVGTILEDKGVVRFSHEFNIYSRLKRLSSKYQAGTYALSPGMTMKEIARIISSGETNTIKVTIPEGFTEYDIADELAKKGACDKKKFIKALESGKFRKEYRFLKGAQKNKHMLEGYLSPKTYEITPGTSCDDIIRMMLDEHEKVFAHDKRKRAKKLGYTENQIIVLASIIEKECGTPDDHRIVSSVIYNRMKKDMALQMDSTIQYVLGLSGDRKKDLSNNDTRIESDYNTYLHKGLPKGPICSPGVSSIEAALYPAKTKYMYFVLDDKLDNRMAFSVKYDDFLKDKDAYYEALEKQEKNKEDA